MSEELTNRDIFRTVLDCAVCPYRSVIEVCLFIADLAQRFSSFFRCCLLHRVYSFKLMNQ